MFTHKKKSAARRVAKAGKRLTVAAGVGAAIGAAAAMLFAPEKGAALRRDLKRGGKKAAVIIAKQKTSVEHELHAVVESLPPAARRSLNLAKSRLAKMIVSAKGKLTSSQYHDMVDKVLRDFEPDGDLVKATLEKARAQWKRAYRTIKRHL